METSDWELQSHQQSNGQPESLGTDSLQHLLIEAQSADTLVSASWNPEHRNKPVCQPECLTYRIMR